MQPLISVIIPTHNSAKTISIAINSILNQTYSNLEIVIIDDNSNDNTQEIVNGFTEKYKNVFYYQLPYDDPNRFDEKLKRNINAGYMSRNYGFEKIKGDWITFQDADDASLLNRIEVQYTLASKYNASHIVTDWQRFDEKILGKILNIEKFMKRIDDFIITKKEITKLAKKTKGAVIPFLGKINSLIPFKYKRLKYINKLFFKSLESYPGAGNSPLFKKEIIKKVKFRSLKNRIWPSFMGRGADRDFNFQVAETFKNSVAFKLPLYLWRTSDQNKEYNKTNITYL